jgi:Tol biopolymer transport system component
MVVQKDVGGSEFWQLYTLANGQLELLTDGKSRNSLNAWSHDGRWLAYTSTRRNGTDNDIYVIDPRKPSSNRLVAQVKGGGWGVSDFAPDGKSAIAVNYVSITDSDLYRLDLASGRMRPIGDPARQVSYGSAQYAPDGTLWVTSDEGSDFQRLGTLDPETGRFTPVAAEQRWDVENFDIAEDGRFIAYVVNEAGISRLKVMDLPSRQVRDVRGLPAGTIGGVEIAPWGDIGFTLSSARSAADVYSVSPASLVVTRWTEARPAASTRARTSSRSSSRSAASTGSPCPASSTGPIRRSFQGAGRSSSTSMAVRKGSPAPASSAATIII